MKKHYIFPFLSAAILSLSLLLSGCGARQTAPSAEDDSVLTIAATTYPVYELLAALTGGMDHVVLTLVVDQQISCLHDYTLTVYALDCELDLAEGYYLNEFRRAIRGHVLAEASLELPSRA